MPGNTPSHDQLFKDLLRNFFDQLIELMVPDLAPELDFEQVEFLEQEFFSDIPAGERSMADLVAKVPTQSGKPNLVLLHGEIERQFRRKTAERLWRYSLHLVLKHDLPVVTLVIYLTGGPGGIRQETLTRGIGLLKTHRFYYYAFGLANSPAQEYLDKPQELAWSLAALMNPGEWDRPRHKLACWQRLVRAKADPARKFLLSNIVETYVKLDTGEQAVYDLYLEDIEEREEIQAMQMTWAEELELKGLEKGLEKGRREGRQEGRQEGMKTLLIQLMERRFGRLPGSILDRLSRLNEPSRLQEVQTLILDAESLDDLKF